MSQVIFGMLVISGRVTNIAPKEMVLYYSINYTLTDLPENVAYFHAQFRRVNPLPYRQVYTILDGVQGWGQYVGTYMAWGSNNYLWWGEGEVKFYLDDDHPTIVTTGTEDYFCGSYNFDPSPRHNEGYVTYTTAYAGFPQVIRPYDDYHTQMRFGLYRWHIPDPIRFEKISRSKSRHWARPAVSDIYHFKMIWLRLPFGIRLFPLFPSHLCQGPIPWRLFNR